MTSAKSPMPFTVGTVWPSLFEAQQAATEYIVGRGESWRCFKNEARCWIRICKRSDICDFRLRLNLSKTGPVQLTVLKPHTCPQSTHEDFRLPHSVNYLIANARSRALLADDRDTRPKQIMAEERSGRGNEISYQQAYRTREKLLSELSVDEGFSPNGLPDSRKTKPRRVRSGIQAHKQRPKRRQYPLSEVSVSPTANSLSPTHVERAKRRPNPPSQGLVSPTVNSLSPTHVERPKRSANPPSEVSAPLNANNPLPTRSTPELSEQELVNQQLRAEFSASQAFAMTTPTPLRRMRKSGRFSAPASTQADEELATDSDREWVPARKRRRL